VVNDGINDDTEKICQSYSDKLDIKYYFSGQRNEKEIIRRTPTVPQNIGIKKSTGDIIIFTCPEIYHLNENGLNNIIEPLINDDDYLTIPNLMWFDDEGYYTKKLLKNKPVKTNRCVLNKDNVEMPFLLGVWKKHVIYIRGYDEDFTGYACEDNDFVDRLKEIGCEYHRVDAEIVHLNHGPRCSGKPMWDNPSWVYNYTLYMKKKNPPTVYEEKSRIIRNLFRDWGEL
jgi:glycosyltransferase involved in cell wall biosynthesis